MKAALQNKLRNLEQRPFTTSAKPPQTVVVVHRQLKPPAKNAKPAPKKPQLTAKKAAKMAAARIFAGEAKNRAAHRAARAQRRATSDEIIVAVRAQWPALFGKDTFVRPLKKGIGHEVSAGLPQFSKRSVRLALSSFLNRLPVRADYLLVISEGGARYGLDGQPTTELVTEEERAVAAQQLTALEQRYPRLKTERALA